MKPPLYVRSLTNAERDALKAGLRSSDAFTLRRSQIILASTRGDTPPTIARQLGCASQTVRNTIRAFHERSLAALQEGSHRNHTSPTSFDAAGLEQLQALAHRSPRDFGHPTSLWTLELLATESARQGLTTRRVSDETIRRAILRLVHDHAACCAMRCS
jgi:transposase